MNNEKTCFEILLECGLCKTKLTVDTEPWLMPCLHSICDKCYKSNKETNTDVECNFCEEKVDCKASTPNYFLLRHFLEKKDAGQQGASSSDATDDGKSSDVGLNTGLVICASCEEKTLATAFCRDCDGPVCNDCVEAHKKPKELRNHEILPRDSTREKAAQMLRNLTTCPTHKEESLVHYCNTCDDLICDLCVTEAHNDHKVVATKVKKDALVENMKSEGHNWVHQIQEKRLLVESAFDENVRCELNINQTERKILTQMLAFEKKFKEWVDNCTSTALSQVKQRYAEKRSVYKREQENLKHLRDKLKHLETFTSSVYLQNYFIALLKCKNFIQKGIANPMEKKITSPLEITKDQPTSSFEEIKQMADSLNTFLDESTEDIFILFKNHFRKSAGNSKDKRNASSESGSQTDSVATATAAGDGQHRAPSCLETALRVTDKEQRSSPRKSPTADKVAPVVEPQNCINGNANGVSEAAAQGDRPSTVVVTSSQTPSRQSPHRVSQAPANSSHPENMSIVRPMITNPAKQNVTPPNLYAQRPKLLTQPQRQRSPLCTQYTVSPNSGLRETPPPPLASLIQHPAPAPPPPPQQQLQQHQELSLPPPVAFTNSPHPPPPPPPLLYPNSGQQGPVAGAGPKRLVGCVVCLSDNSSPLPHVRCNNCCRWFHYQCHIPSVDPGQGENWRCILCSNITIQNDASGSEFNGAHKLACSRILLRLVSQINSVKFRCQLRIYSPPPHSKEGVSNGVNFDAIKDRIWSQSATYKNVAQFVDDVKNALNNLDNYNRNNPQAIDELRGLGQFFDRQIQHDIPFYKGPIHSQPGNQQHMYKRPRIEK